MIRVTTKDIHPLNFYYSICTTIHDKNYKFKCDDDGDFAYTREDDDLRLKNRLWVHYHDDQSSDNIAVFGIIGPADPIDTVTVKDYADIHTEFVNFLLQYFDKEMQGIYVSINPVKDIDHFKNEI